MSQILPVLIVKWHVSCAGFKSRLELVYSLPNTLQRLLKKASGISIRHLYRPNKTELLIYCRLDFTPIKQLYSLLSFIKLTAKPKVHRLENIDLSDTSVSKNPDFEKKKCSEKQI